jgi:UDP-glucose 4-epimerase
MSILVTGGAGYIGSVTTELLLGAGHEVVVYDNLLYGHRDAVPPAAVFEQGDLANKGRLIGVFRAHSIDAVMHVSNAISLLEVMTTFNVGRFILSSTAAVYGDPEHIPIREEDRLAPSNPYGESKLMIERMLHWCEVRYGLQYASLRYFNAAGASAEHGEDHRPETHLIPLALNVALGLKERLDIYGADYPTPDGTCVRDYIHVVDLAQAHILALEALSESGRVYNLGNGQGFSVQEVVIAAREVTGRPIPTQVVPRRPGDPATLVASSDRVRRELGWEPRFPDLRDIIESAWLWTRAFPAGYAH